MRDYKNVKVPRSYRAGPPRSNVKRVHLARWPRRETSGLLAVLVRVMVAVLVIGGCFLGWMVYQWAAHSETFQIAGVDVTGAPHLSKDELKNVAGVFTGQNIFSVNLDAAAQRARALTWVKDVRLYRHLPNRISMTISERTPAAVLDNGSGRSLVDDDGVVIAREGKNDPVEQPLPTILIHNSKALPGQPVASDGLAEALVLLGEIAARGGWNRADITIKADSEESLTAVYGGHEFKLGSGNYAEKLRRLGEVMTDMQQRGLTIAYVDLRPERQAAAMPVKDKARGVEQGTRSGKKKPGMKRKG